MKICSMGMLKLVTCASFLAAIASGGDAAATQMTIPAASCGYVLDANWSVPAVSPAWQLKRYQNGGISNPDTNGHNIACAVPRVNAGDNALSFYLDGDNVASGSSTACTIYQYSFDNVLQSSDSTNQTSSGSYDVNIAVAAGTLYDYLTVVCTLQGSNRTTFRGIALDE